jgi:uncharacterized membrane protein (UPF0127 family)
LPENPTYTAENVTRGTALAARIRIAGTSAERRRGLLENESLEPGDGLWIAPCEAIHTLGMKWPIDVLFLDKEYRVRKMASELSPWRIAVCWTADSVLELPAGVLKPTGTKIGDIVAFHCGL